MSRPLSHILLALVMPLTACAVGNSSNPSPKSNPVSPSTTGNWQIQSGTPASPTTQVLMAGSLFESGSQVTATFQTTPICGAPGAYSFAGTLDSSGNLTLTATPLSFYTVNLAVPSDPNTYSTGTFAGTGIVCAVALGPGPAIGVEIDPLDETYAGTLATDVVYAGTSTPAPGAASLTLTQSAAPTASGQFPLTGSLTFQDFSCPLTLALTGTVIGTQFTLASNPSAQPSVTLSGTVNPLATQLQISNLQIVGGPCSSAGGLWTGTLLAP